MSGVKRAWQREGRTVTAFVQDAVAKSLPRKRPPHRLMHSASSVKTGKRRASNSPRMRKGRWYRITGREVRKADISLVDWSPSKRSEQAGMRPAVVVRTDAANLNPRYPNTVFQEKTGRNMVKYSNSLLEHLYRTMVRIRSCEESLVEPILGGEVRCPCQLYSGQEAIAAGICASLNEND